jgi:ADP-ribosylation factor GTPase-activating protein 1
VAAQAGQTIQSGAKGAAESLNKFVEGQDEKASGAASRGSVVPERQDFWDSFGASEVTAEHGKPSTLGTNAMKGGAAGGKGKEDGWGDDW